MVNMETHSDAGFEALLKPLQDITSKVWNIALTKALENYMEQFSNGDKACVNFIEAAVLVQNSASFYCKRVDSVHLGCQRFVEKLMDTYFKVFGTNRIMDIIIHENVKPNKDKEPDGQTVKRKRTAKTFVNDDFELLDLFCPDGNISLDWNTHEKNDEKKQVILNKNVKVTRKPNSSCPFYQTKGVEMGLKEEFRLNWRSSSNGVLFQDFNFLSNAYLLSWTSLPDEVLEARVEDSFHMDVGNFDEHFSSFNIAPPETPVAASPNLPVSPEPALPLPPAEPIVEKRTLKNPYNSELMKIPSIEFLKKKNFSLPKNLIDAAKEWKLRKLANKEKSEEDYSFTSFFEFMKHRVLLQCPSSKQVKLVRSAKERREEIQRRRKFYERAVARAEQYNDNDDFCGFDADNADPPDDNLDELELNLDDDDDDLNQVEIGGFSQERDEIMLATKDFKKQDAAELAETARRVQMWHESLADVLDNAENRAQYDIHQYGTEILEKFDEAPEKRPVISFKKVVKNQPKHEISRFLLSTLMLANTYNVEIITEPGELVKDCVQLKLLSTVRHHEEMDENLKANTHC